MARRLSLLTILLLVACNGGSLRSSNAVFEFGFPSPTRHALYPRPYLGFGGALAFADSMANTMCQYATYRAGTEASRGPRRDADPPKQPQSSP